MARKPTLRQLFPDQTDEQIDRIGEFLHNYSMVIWRIYERLERDHPEIIDDLIRAGSMKGKGRFLQ